MNGGGGAATFRARGGAPKVGADGKAMGVDRETMACFGGRRSARKKKKGGRASVARFWPERREREPGGLAIVAPHGGGVRGVRAWVAHGQAATAAGPKTMGTGGCRQRGTGEGRERGGAAVWLACGPARGCGAQPQGERGNK
jgi:hypothetical protein